MKPFIYLFSLISCAILVSCQNNGPKKDSTTVNEASSSNPITVHFSDSQANFTIHVEQTGRYKVSLFGEGKENGSAWIEDYINNKDGRSYNITGSIPLNQSGVGSVDGSPLAKGKHDLKLHLDGEIQIDSIEFDLIAAQKPTKTSLKQEMSGEEWSLVWSDEFEGNGRVDTNKWSYNIGNWGWGNNEPQYYTSSRLKNARKENGHLIIEAHQNDMGYPWTSARLTTQSKISFLYGRIEFRANVPTGRGTWAAGWLLGDAYEDEMSWPYCGEIDVLECVGFEINDSSGQGLNHATCHTRAYYFKQNNQIGSEIAVDSMNTKFHTYAVEWYPDVIHGYLDGELYYTYDKNANEYEWPFHQPQNIIVNLAVGGGWGGLKGIDSSWNSHQYIIDYVRVYEKR